MLGNACRRNRVRNGTGGTFCKLRDHRRRFFSHHRLLVPARHVDRSRCRRARAGHAAQGTGGCKSVCQGARFARADQGAWHGSPSPLNSHTDSRAPIVPFSRSAHSLTLNVRTLGPPQANTIFGRLLSSNSLPRKTMRQNCGKTCSLVRPALCFDQRLFVVCSRFWIVYPRFYPDFSSSRIFSLIMQRLFDFVVAVVVSGVHRRGARVVCAAVGRAQANRRVRAQHGATQAILFRLEVASCARIVKRIGNI